MRFHLAFVLASLLTTACAGEVQYSGPVGVVVTTPDLVEVSPGVRVIADYEDRKSVV